jgi:DNA-binding CsgD family transcriptional regulator
MSVYVRIDDVYALLKLVGEAREILDAGECPRLHVLQGLTRIVGAAVGVSLIGGSLRAAAPDVRHYLDHGWSMDDRRRVLQYYGSRPGTDDPMIAGMLRMDRRSSHATFRRTDLIESRSWYESTLHNELHRPGRVDDVIFSARFLNGDDAMSALVLKRAAGDRPFSVEERELVHLFRSESDWMFRPETKPSSVVVEGLTRREQETLDLLLTDASEKLVAARLGISPHTVHDHVKKLYRKLGVTSRAALMALALSSDAQRAAGASPRSGSRPS